MTVRADWGTTAATAEPAAQVADPEWSDVMTSTAPKPVNLDTPEPELRANLEALVRREARLFDCGITCPLKDLPDGNCTACPVTRAHETDGPLDVVRMGQLCRVGTEQERVAMMLLVKQRRGV